MSVEDLIEKISGDIENDMEVNPENIGEELLKQSSTYFLYSKAAAEARLRVKEAQENIKIVRSELIREVSEDPELFEAGKKKVTVQEIESYYRTQRTHKTAKENLIEKEYELDVIEAARSAIYMKKMVLENLVKLISLNWYSAPKETPVPLNELNSSVTGKEADKKIRRKLRRKKIKGE